MYPEPSWIPPIQIVIFFGVLFFGILIIGMPLFVWQARNYLKEIRDLLKQQQAS